MKKFYYVTILLLMLFHLALLKNNIFANNSHALLSAAEIGNINKIKTAISNGTDINYQNEYGLTALMIACRNGKFESAEFLIQKGANIHLKTKQGTTAIMFIFHALCNCQGGQTDFARIIKLLLEKGADVESADAEGKTLLMIAAPLEHLEITSLLLKHHAKVNAVMTRGYYQGRTALHFVADKREFTQSAKILVYNGADVNRKDINGWTPFMYAAKNGNLNLVRLLISRGARMSLRNKMGESVRQIAYRFGKMNIIHHLEQIERR